MKTIWRVPGTRAEQRSISRHAALMIDHQKTVSLPVLHATSERESVPIRSSGLVERKVRGLHQAEGSCAAENAGSARIRSHFTISSGVAYMRARSSDPVDIERLARRERIPKANVESRGSCRKGQPAAIEAGVLHSCGLKDHRAECLFVALTCHFLNDSTEQDNTRCSNRRISIPVRMRASRCSISRSSDPSAARDPSHARGGAAVVDEIRDPGTVRQQMMDRDTVARIMPVRREVFRDGIVSVRSFPDRRAS